MYPMRMDRPGASSKSRDKYCQGKDGLWRPKKEGLLKPPPKRNSGRQLPMSAFDVAHTNKRPQRQKKKSYAKSNSMHDSWTDSVRSLKESTTQPHYRIKRDEEEDERNHASHTSFCTVESLDDSLNWLEAGMAMDASNVTAASTRKSPSDSTNITDASSVSTTQGDSDGEDALEMTNTKDPRQQRDRSMSDFQVREDAEAIILRIELDKANGGGLQGNGRRSAKALLRIAITSRVCWVLGGLLLLLVSILSMVSMNALSPNSNANIGLTSSSGKCFDSLTELRKAVDAYVKDPSPETLVAEKYGYPIGAWCVSQVDNFQNLFSAKRNPAMATFNEAIGHWDTGKVTNMKEVFEGAASFNQDISNWDVSQVTHMESMFSGATLFSQDLCLWGNQLAHRNVAVHEMFTGAESCESSDAPHLEHKHRAAGPLCAVCGSRKPV